MNIEVKVLYSVFFNNQILLVVPLYDFSFSRVVLISHSHLFSFVSEERKKSIIFGLISQLLSFIIEEIKKKVILSYIT